MRKSYLLPNQRTINQSIWWSDQKEYILPVWWFRRGTQWLWLQREKLRLRPVLRICWLLYNRDDWDGGMLISDCGGGGGGGGDEQHVGANTVVGGGGGGGGVEDEEEMVR